MIIYNLSNIGKSIKVLFSGYLTVIAVGYAMAIMQIMFTHGMADGEFGLSVNDIVYSYYGNRSGTVIENKLNASMSAMAPNQERFKIIEWVRNGALEEEFKPEIKQIFDTRCVQCHNAESSLPDFTKFENIVSRAESDHGMTFSSLARVSHIHLFGIAFIFMFVGLIFGLSTGVPVTLKEFAIGMPYLFLLMDITSWWLTKLDPMFAWIIIIGGAGLGLSFVFMWCVCIYEMWIMPKIHSDNRNPLLDE